MIDNGSYFGEKTDPRYESVMQFFCIHTDQCRSSSQRRYARICQLTTPTRIRILFKRYISQMQNGCDSRKSKTSFKCYIFLLSMATNITPSIQHNDRFRSNPSQPWLCLFEGSLGRRPIADLEATRELIVLCFF